MLVFLGYRDGRFWMFRSYGGAGVEKVFGEYFNSYDNIGRF